MANIILHKRNSTPGTVPTSGALSQGELGINIGDGKLYTKNSGNNIINLGVTSISGTSITPSSGNFSNYLAVNSVPVSVSGHSHTSVPQAQSLVTNVFNKTASTIPKFSVVYIDGGQGDQPTIQLAIANSESGSSKTYGITAEAISSMSAGSVIVAGALSGINTDQFNPTAPTGDVNGTSLWLSPTVSGSVTTTKPYASNHAVFIGTIVRTHQNAGVVEVRVQNGYELEELHNVAISGVSNGQFLYYNSSSGLWQPNSNIYSSGSNIGIGTTSPESSLVIASAGANGTIGGAAQTQIFQVNDASASDYVNLGHFNCEASESRGSFMLSNNGTNLAWQDNVMQFFVHGASYPYGYYGGNASDAGCAMIVTQGSEITKLQIGNYGSAPIEFFTSNAKKFGIEDNGNITIFDYIESDYTEGNYLVWNNTYNDTGPLAAIGLVTGDSSAEGTLVFHTGPANSTAERLKIDENGNVGIGTIGNSITAKLEVVGNVNIDGNLTFDSFTESVVAIGNSSTSKTIDLTSGTVQTCTLTGNCTFTMPTATAGKSFNLFLNSGAGNYTAIFTGVRWADSATPTATILANKVDIYSFISDGTYWYGSFSQNYG